jgi:hypothetical protein
MLDDLDLHDWVSLFQNIIQRVLTTLCHGSEISKIPLCVMIGIRGVLTSQIFTNNHFHFPISVELVTFNLSLYCWFHKNKSQKWLFVYG